MNTKEFHEILIDAGWLTPEAAKDLQQIKDVLTAQVEALKDALNQIADFDGQDLIKIKLFACTAKSWEGKDYLPELQANAIRSAIEKTGQPMQFIDLNEYPLPPRVCLAADLYQLARDIESNGVKS